MTGQAGEHKEGVGHEVIQTIFFSIMRGYAMAKQAKEVGTVEYIDMDEDCG